MISDIPTFHYGLSKGRISNIFKTN